MKFEASSPLVPRSLLVAAVGLSLVLVGTGWAHPVSASPLPFLWTDTIHVGTEPLGLAVNPSTSLIYVANSMPGTVSVISALNNSLISTIPTGSAPYAVAVNAKTNTIYVINYYSNDVSVLSGKTNTVTDNIPLVTTNSEPDAITVNPQTNMVYVASLTYDDVIVISGATNAVVATVHVGEEPDAITVNPATNTVYVANTISDTVSVISGATNTVNATVNVGEWPDGVAVDSANNMVYVSTDADNYASVVNSATNRMVAQIDIGTNQTSVAVDPTTDTVFIATNFNTVAVINGTTNTPIGAINVAYEPFDITLDPALHSAYVTNEDGEELVAEPCAVNLQGAGNGELQGACTGIPGGLVSVLSPPTSTTVVSCASSSARVGSSVSCDATVKGASPTGMVNWTSTGGSFSATSCTLASSACSVTFTPKVEGNLTVTAYYATDPNNAVSVANATLKVTEAPASGLSALVIPAVLVLVIGVILLVLGLLRGRTPKPKAP